MSSRALVVAVCIATALVAGSAVPGTADVAGSRGMAPFSLFDEAVALAGPDRAFLTGDWGGLRTRLLDLGITPSLVLVSLRGGRVAAGDEFLTSPLYGTFVQAAFNGNPMGIFLNVPMTTYPTATWGMRARVRPISQPLRDGGRVQRRPHARRQ